MAESPYRVFLSAASLDFRSWRPAVAQALREFGPHICPHGPLGVVYQEDFPPDYRDVWEMLRQTILGCDAVVCLVGYAFGREPRDVPPNVPRQSYTQLEFEIARALGKPVFLFLAADPAQLDPHPPEPDDLRALQDRFRDKLEGLDQVRQSFRTRDDLLAQLGKLQLPPPSPRKPINLPHKTLGSLFKGRDEFLRDLRQKLGAGDGRAVGVLATQSIHGLGGVGKTRLAIEYGWRYQADYTALLFVSADTPERLRSNLAELVGPQVLDLKEARQAQEEPARVEAALRWLETHLGWFLVLDNVDTEEAAREAEALLVRLRRGHVLITSRLRQWGPGVERLELDVLDPDAATEFLLERTAGARRPTANDPADARALAETLGGLALALEQAGAYISYVRHSLAEYLARWRQQEEQVLTWFDERVMKYPRSIAVTWETTVSRLTPAARTLLEILSWFAPDPIPEWVLTGAESKAVVVAALDGGDVLHALAELENYSLLKRELTAEQSSLLVHRLVQEITRWRLPAAVAGERLAKALALVHASAAGDPQDIRTWPVWEPLTSHLRELVKHGDHFQIHQPTTRLMGDLGILLFAKALHAQAEPLMRRALAIDEHRFGANHTSVAIALNNLATLLQATNRLAEAEPLMRRALAIHEQSFGADHPEVATALNNLAQLLQTTNRLAKAEPLMRRALAIDEHSFGDGHPKVARDLNNLAQLLQATNRLAEAEPLMRRVVAILEKSLGPEHPNVATALNNLAQLLQATNRLAEAEPLMRRALAIDEQGFGDEHPNVARDLHSLSQLLQATNRLAEAEPLMRRALAIDEHSFGDEHPNVARDLENLGHLLHATNRLAEAELLLRRALVIDEHSFGTDHPEVATALNNLAQVLKATNRLAEAEPLMRRVVTIYEKALGPEHPNVAAALNNLAQLLQAANRLGEAEPLLRRALAIDEHSLGDDHPRVATDLHNLAALFQATNRFGEAEPLIRRAVAIDEHSFGDEHPNVARDLNNLATLLQATNRLAEAEPFMRRVVAIFEKDLGPEHPNVAAALNNLAHLLLATNRLAEAQPMIRRGVSILLHFERSTGHMHPHLKTALANYEVLLKAMGRSHTVIQAELAKLIAENL